jgi:hypothetical protein
MWMSALPLSAQLSFSVVLINGERPVNAQVQLDAAAAGDTLDTLFRVRNTSKSPAPLTFLTIAGSGFSLTNLPSLPATLSPGAYADFTVRFRPPSAGSFSALLKTDGESVFVLARAVESLTLYLDVDGYRKQIDSRVAIDFGTVERGSRGVRRLWIANQTSQPLAAPVGVAGTAFQLGAASGLVSLDPQSSTALDLLFAPTQTGVQQGEFRIDQRRFVLRGSALEPPLPKPLVIVDLKGQPPASGAQPVAAVRFDPAPRTSGTGTLQLELRPSVEAKEDAAVMFLSTGSRTIGFSVIEGEANAQFGAAAAIPFQTGTTAGTLVITARVGDAVETASIEIPPQPVAIDTVQMARSGSGIVVQISGYDNTRSISQASFTFLQKDGTPLPPGAIQQDLAAVFKDYFTNSSLGGSFQMKASFPVTGDGGLIDSVRVVLINSLGQTAWPSSGAN